MKKGELIAEFARRTGMTGSAANHDIATSTTRRFAAGATLNAAVNPHKK